MTFAPAQLGDVCIILLSLLVQGIPFLLFGALLGGFVAAWSPFNALLRRWPRSTLASAVAGAAFALLIPACDCAAVPVVRRLIRKGIPLSAGISYLLAAPVFNPVCMISTYLAFRFGAPWKMLALREGGALFLAVVIGVAASRVPASFLLKSSVLVGSNTPEPLPWMEVAPNGSPLQRTWTPILATTLIDFLNISTLFVLGAIVAALLQSFVPLGELTVGHAGLGVPTAMIMAFFLSLCSSADAFVVNGFGALGVAGQLAFLWLGPIYNLRVLFLYRNVFQLRAIVLLGLATVLLIALMTFVVAKSGLT